MTSHPEVQRKLQEEVDIITGGRGPRLSDKKGMPYTEAVRLYLDSKDDIRNSHFLAHVTVNLLLNGVGWPSCFGG